MPSTENSISDKIEELEQEMKAAGLWQKQSPDWVNNFDEKIIFSGNDFAHWLQFVFMPNHINSDMGISYTKEKKMIVPAAIKFFGDDVQKGKLLQLLIEIDALL